MSPQDRREGGGPAIAGTLIGTNDLWIAATALVHDLPVVTRNTKDFRRVPGLDVRGY